METINLKEIVKELFLEEGNKGIERKDGKSLFNSYYNTKKAQFDKILEVTGIDKESFKNGKDYAIPPEDKELIKAIFEEVNSTYAKGLRLNNPDKYTKYDRFDFLLNIENRLEEKYKGIELLKQKERFYGYSNLISEYKVYCIKDTISSFLDLQLHKLQINDEYIKIDEEALNIQENKLKALEKNNIKKFFDMVEVPEDDDKHIGFYTLTENDRILVLGLYETMIKNILEELESFTEKLSDSREFFGGKDAKEVFIETVNDYKETLENDGEPMPENCKKAIEELLKERNMKKKTTEK